MYQSEYNLGQVGLYVEDLIASREFYCTILGLQILKEFNGEIILGVDGESLVHLIEYGEKTHPLIHYRGLYHMAFLLPSRQDLSNIFKRLIDLKIPITGTSDHGYSQAIYFNDNEGNGIEIYYDKPFVEWDIRNDGRIIGVTEQLDTYDLYHSGVVIENYQLPSLTMMGHVHLSVSKSKESSLVYQRILGMTEKFGIESASWIASGDYHHHLAFNEWQNYCSTVNKQIALAYFTLIISDEELLSKVADISKTLGSKVEFQSSSEILIKDVEGIRVRLIIE